MPEQGGPPGPAGPTNLGNQAGHPFAAKARRSLRHPIEELGAAAVIAFVLGFVLGAAVLLVLHLQHWLPSSGQRQVDAFSEVSEPESGDLAARFRPRLLFDSGELWRPLNVSSMLDEGTHRFCTRLKKNVSCLPVRSSGAFGRLAQSAGALGPATYVDIAGGKVADYRGPERCPGRLLDCGTGPRAAIYYHVTESNDRFYIDYWWFLRFNHFSKSEPKISCRSQVARQNGVCDEHEGDWEGVTVVTPPDDDKHIAYVVYAAHKGTFRYAASQLQVQGGARPDVYVARGSHASYPRACLTGDCLQPNGLAADGLVNLPEGDYDGKAGWARNDDACVPNAPGSCLQSLKLQPWTDWPGQWGAGCGDACGGAPNANSPHSPGLQARFQSPWCSTQNGVFSCDGRALACSDWLGPLVAAVACDPTVLSASLHGSNAVDPRELALVIGAERISQPSTPGVVQSLGDPFQAGKTFTVIADGPSTEILLRTRQGNVTVEDRFAGLPVKAGQRVVVNIVSGLDGPTVTADGRPPLERRILQPASALTTP
jgi:hypothetical protein